MWLGDYRYEYVSEGGVVLTGYRGGDADLIIPAELDGCMVTVVGTRAFQKNETIQSVRLPEGLESIGSKAFGSCLALKQVTVPGSVRRIASDAFEGSPDVALQVYWGSFANTYAEDNGIACEVVDEPIPHKHRQKPGKRGAARLRYGYEDPEQEEQIMYALTRKPYKPGKKTDAYDPRATGLPTADALHEGDAVVLGRYPQTWDGQELPIEWTVLEVDERRERALLLSRYVLDWKPFDSRVGDDEPEWCCWHDSTLRAWMNGEFVDEAFEDEDLELLDGDLPFAPDGKVCLLSAWDIKRYFPGEYDTGFDDMFFHSCESPEATDYVRGCRSGRRFDHDYPEWWTRSDLYSGNCIQTVKYYGVDVTVLSPGVEKGVRPAVWLKLAKRYSVWKDVATVRFNDGVTQQEQDEFFEQLCLADAGDARYAALLGVKFFNGDQVRRDYEEAARWYAIAAEAGIAQAQLDLADCYLQGLGVPRSESEGIYWARSAADLGFANAQANLGVWYVRGAHVKRDREEGERLLRAAAAQKAYNWEFAYDSLAAALALHDDAALKEEALAYMTEAAEAGYVYSMERLCKAYELGWYDMGAYRDADLALVWARRGSEAGSALCRAVLAERYRRGVGVTKDEGESARLAQMSADSGCFLGYHVLAQLHEERGELGDDPTGAIVDSSHSRGSLQGVPVRDGLSGYSWAELKLISQAIAVAKSDAAGLAIAGKYNLVDSHGRLRGYRKLVTLKDGTRASVRVVGFRHDTLVSDERSGITFEFVGVGARYRMNDFVTTVGGWKASTMRAWLNSDFYALLPDDLRTCLEPARKRTNNRGNIVGNTENGGDTIFVTETEDALWLLSLSEVYGRLSSQTANVPSSPTTYDAEGTQYQLYADQGVTTSNYGFCKRGWGSASSWSWLRSPATEFWGFFLCVRDDGDWSVEDAPRTLGVFPGFCF